MVAPRVLVMDDDQRMHVWLNHILTSNGFECRRAQNGAEALGVLQTWPPQVILMDLDTPAMELETPVTAGDRFLRMRRGCPELLRLPVVALTGSPAAAPLTKDPQVDAVILKPYRSAQLMATLTEVCSVDGLWSASGIRNTAAPTSHRLRSSQG